MNLFSYDNSNLLKQLRYSILKAKKIDIIVAFLLDSGIKLLIEDLKKAAKNGADIRLLTGIYLNVTEPNALYRLLNELKNDIKIHIYNNYNRSFHPKTYIFEYPDGDGDIIIGSSNISKTALIDGIEWNYKLNKNIDNTQFNNIIDQFNNLYENSSDPLSIEFLRKYQKNYKKTIFNIETDQYEDSDNIEPINFQIPALFELNKTRDEGYKKAMIIAATGLGKTYLTIFDSINFDKTLFIAHREEILIQAKKSFKKVKPKLKYGFFKGDKKDYNKDILFGSVQTLGKLKYLEKFDKKYFDYIIIDEFHHSAAKYYQNIINYFQPKFLLGITATPYRMDNKDIYKFCDYNVAYECDLKTAINNSWLVPFKYFGIYDDIDYDKISWRNGKYSINELTQALIVKKRANNILDNYLAHNQGKTVAFCASIKHTEFMKLFFIDKKIKAEALHSGSKYRKKIIKSFENGDIDILFVVDIFNEGVDIPAINTVLFLRPTESYNIFIQQLGRGLRLSKNKDYLVVLDFVGNYKGVKFKYQFLTGEFNPNNEKIADPTDKNYKLPNNCQAFFDFKVIDILKDQLKKEPIKIKLIKEYKKIKNELNKTPLIKDIFENSDYPFKIYRSKFKSWLKFRSDPEIDDLTKLEKIWLNNIVGDFFEDIEKTLMSRSYKIPIFLSFIQNSITVKTVSIDYIGKFFYNFYNKNSVYKKDLTDKNWDIKNFTSLAINNPIKFLSKGPMGRYFEYNKVDKTFSIKNSLFLEIDKSNKKFTTSLHDRIFLKLNSYFQRKFNSDGD